MSYTVLVSAFNFVGHCLYETQYSVEGIEAEKVPGAAIEFAIERIKNESVGLPLVQLRVATWTVRQLWVGQQYPNRGGD